MKQPLIALALLGGLTAATATGKVRAAAAAPCAEPVRHQFDFWIGDWQVYANGKQVGTNRIDSLAGGCALLENWVGAGGVRGHSLNFYDATRGSWHQTWVDSTGTSLLLDGHFKDGHMVLSSEKPGQRVVDRITWTPNADGTVRQLWQHTDDGGAKWSVAFDGLYRRTGK
jgi:hypothetical protein